MILPQLPRLPRVELHLHLDGALRTQTILELAEEAGVPLPAATATELGPHVQVSPDCRSLGDFLDTFEVFYPALRGPEAVRRMTREAFEDAVAAGCVYVEGRFAPVLQSTPGFPIPAVVDAALEGLAAARESTGMDLGLILCCYRSESPASSLETVVEAASRRADGVVGVDLAGDEVRFRVGEHRQALAEARQLGIPLTVHAGEAGPVENIREAVQELGAARLGHALRLPEDPGLWDEVRERGIVVESCLTSNLHTGVVGTLEEHPFPRLLRGGLRVTLNTDDPRVSGVDLAMEQALAARTFDLGLADLRVLTEHAVAGAFCDEPTRQRVASRIHAMWPA